jgi:hypothetical protein
MFGNDFSAASSGWLVGVKVLSHQECDRLKEGSGRLQAGQEKGRQPLTSYLCQL